jgi:hypothetical protein
LTEIKEYAMDEFPDWLDMVRKACTPEVWAKIIDAVRIKAEKGDPKAVEFFETCVLPKEKEPANGNTVKEVRIVLVKDAQ